MSQAKFFLPREIGPGRYQWRYGRIYKCPCFRLYSNLSRIPMHSDKSKRRLKNKTRRGPSADHWPSHFRFLWSGETSKRINYHQKVNIIYIFTYIKILKHRINLSLVQHVTKNLSFDWHLMVESLIVMNEWKEFSKLFHKKWLEHQFMTIYTAMIFHELSRYYS